MSESIVTGSYAPNGTISVPGETDRPEPRRDSPVMLDRAAVLKKFKWTDSEFELAEKYNLPRALKRTRMRTWGHDLIWPEAELDAWMAALKADIQRLMSAKEKSLW